MESLKVWNKFMIKKISLGLLDMIKLESKGNLLID